MTFSIFIFHGVGERAVFLTLTIYFTTLRACSCNKAVYTFYADTAGPKYAFGPKNVWNLCQIIKHQLTRLSAIKWSIYYTFHCHSQTYCHLRYRHIVIWDINHDQSHVNCYLKGAHVAKVTVDTGLSVVPNLQCLHYRWLRSCSAKLEPLPLPTGSTRRRPKGKKCP